MRRSLRVARESGDQRRESIALGNLCIAYKNLGQLNKALECGLGALDIDQAIEDAEGLSNGLGNVGNVSHYHRMGDFEKAIEHHNQALTISRRLENRQMEANDLKNLGMSQIRLGLRNIGNAKTIFEDIDFNEGLEATKEMLAAVGRDAFEF